MKTQLLLPCLFLPLFAACSTSHPLIPDKSVVLSHNVQVPLDTLVIAAAAGYVVWKFVDPMAPNWGIESTKLAQGRYQIDLKQRRFAIGGDGESNQSFHRTAQALAQKDGFTGYSVLSYTEGLEAGPLLSQRVARGVVQLDGAITTARTDAEVIPNQ